MREFNEWEGEDASRSLQSVSFKFLVRTRGWGMLMHSSKFPFSTLMALIEKEIFNLDFNFLSYSKNIVPFNWRCGH